MVFAQTTTGVGAGSATVQNPNVFSCLTSPATCGVFYVALTVNGFMGVLVSVGAFLVRLGLQFNDNIFNSPAVLTGFSVSLAIANLGFILGIIIIAIATIIRNQTYGIKQLLWKLVFMAILVNFGLVITAPIVGFASDMSNYFINATSPGSVSVAGYEGYATAITAAFAPQLFVPGESQAQAVQAGQAAMAACSYPAGQPVSQGQVALCAQAVQNAQQAAQNTSPQQSNDTFWQETMAMFFDVIFTSLIAFVFITLAILLLVRYLMLGGLLIVLPLAWLTFVFPKFDSSYSKWWDAFIKWVFFPPLALFFIYLAIITATTAGGGAVTAGAGNTPASSYLTQAAGLPSGTTTGVEEAVYQQTGLSGILQQAADEILLVGLTIMGLMFANSLAGKAGSTVVNGASAVTKAAAGYVGKRGRYHATKAYQKAGGDKLNKWMQSNRKIPFASIVGRGMTNLTEGGTKDLVAERSKSLDFASMDDDRLISVTKGLNGLAAGADQIGAVQEWQKRGKLDKIDEVGGMSFEKWLTKNQGNLGYMAQGKLRSDIDKQLMSDEEMRRIARVQGEASSKAQVVDKTGIMGTAGATVLASALQKEADALSESAKKSADAGINTVVHKGRRVNSTDLFNESRAAVKEAREAQENAAADAEISNGSGQKVKAGELMEAASEKFWKGKDKGDVTKMRPDWMFTDKPKFGLDDATLKALQKGTAHGIAVETPSHFGAVAGKVANSHARDELVRSYIESAQKGFESGKISPDEKKNIDNSLRKILNRLYSQVGGGDGGDPTDGDGGGGGGGGAPAPH